MKRVCAIGNSHLAAVALGWRNLEAAIPSVNLTFFGAQKDYLTDLTVLKGRLRAKSHRVRKIIRSISGGQADIVVGDYDEFWLIGLGLGVQQLMLVYARYWSESHKGDEKRAPISNAAFLAAVRGNILSTLAIRVHDQIRSLSSDPIRLIMEPMLSESALDSNDIRTSAWAMARDRDEELVLSGQLATVIESMRRDGYDVIPPPDESLASPLFSLPNLCRGSVRLSNNFKNEHGDDDFTHMNEQYGRMVVERMLRQRDG